MRKFLYSFLIVFTAFWGGCEKVGEDIDPDIEESTETTGRVFYTFQNNIVAIDPISLVTSSEVERINILTTPTFGNISFSNDGLLVYTPNDNIVEATEQITLETVKKNGKKTTSDITIKIITENFQLPCINLAMGDKLRTNTNTAATIEVLKNDVICEGTFKQLNIKENPQNGEVSLTADNKVIYTPKAGFKGTDRFLYEIDIENEGKIVKKFAFCLIQVIDNTCKTSLKPDIIYLKQQNFYDTLRIAVLANDDLCPDDLTKGKLEIKTNPKRGKATLLPNKTIVYEFNFGTTPTPTLRDSFEYKFTTALGENLVSKVLVLMPPLGCKLAAIEDNISVIKSKIVGLDVINLDVLENDILCNFQYKDLNIKILPSSAPLYKDLSITSDKKVALKIPKGNLPKQVFFNYKITNNKGEETMPALVKIKFVD